MKLKVGSLIRNVLSTRRKPIRKAVVVDVEGSYVVVYEVVRKRLWRLKDCEPVEESALLDDTADLELAG